MESALKGKMTRQQRPFGEKSLMFNILKYPYFRVNALEKRKVRRLMQDEKLFELAEQVHKIGDIDDYIDKEQEMQRREVEGVAINWTDHNFVYIAPSKVNELYSQGYFPHFWYKQPNEDGKLRDHFLQNQAWKWWYKHTFVLEDEYGDSYKYFDLEYFRLERLSNILSSKGNIARSKEERAMTKRMETLAEKIVKNLEPDNLPSLKEEHESIRRVLCVLCEKISVLPSLAESDGGGVLDIWPFGPKLPLDQQPDYSQQCHREHCYEFRAIFEDQEEIKYRSEMRRIRSLLNQWIKSAFKRPPSPVFLTISDENSGDQDSSSSSENESSSSKEEEQKQPAKQNPVPQVMSDVVAQPHPSTDLEEKLALALALDLEAERNFYKIKQLTDRPHSSGAFSGFAAATKFWFKGTDEDKKFLECYNSAPPKFRHKEVEYEFSQASDMIKSFIIKEYNIEKDKAQVQPQDQEPDANSDSSILSIAAELEGLIDEPIEQMRERLKAMTRKIEEQDVEFQQMEDLLNALRLDLNEQLSLQDPKPHPPETPKPLK